MLKRILIILVFFLMTIFMLMPLATGFLFKQDYLNLISIINKDKWMQIELLDYKQGWFHSYAKIRINFIDKAVKNIPSFTMEQEISHGPIIHDRKRHVVRFGYANIESDIYLSSQKEKIVYDDSPHTSVIEIITIAQFDGDWFAYINIPTIFISAPEIGKLYIEKFSGEVKMYVHKNEISHVKMTMQTGLINLQIFAKNSYISKIDIQPILYQYDAVHEKSGLWSGNAVFTIPTVVINEIDGSSVILHKFLMTNSFSAGGDTFYNTNLAINIDAAQILLSPLIPTLSSLDILISANNFDMQIIDDFIVFLKSSNPKEIININYEKIASLLASMVTRVSVLSLDASAKTPIGDISFHSRSTWSLSAPLPKSIADIIVNSDTKIDLRGSASFVEKLIESYGSSLITEKTNIAPAKTGKDYALPLIKSSQANLPGPTLNSDEVKKLISYMILLGYFSKDVNEYYTTVTFENGICKINRVVICPEQLKISVPMYTSK